MVVKIFVSENVCKWKGMWVKRYTSENVCKLQGM